MQTRKTLLCCALVALGALGVPAYSLAVIPCLYTETAGSTSARDFGYAIATDAAQNIYYCGTFENTVDLGGGVLTTAGGRDIFVAKYDASGTHVWSFRAGGAGDDTPSGIAVDATGRVAITGFFSGTSNFGGSDLTAQGAQDIFLADYDANGVHRWSKKFGAGDVDKGNTVAFDPDGNVILGGQYGGAADFGGGPSSTFGAPELVLAKYDADGTYLWSKAIASSGGEWAQDVACDADGNICALVWNGGGNDFGGGALTPGAAIVKLDPAGTHIWSKGFTGAITPKAIALDASANVLISGSFLASVNFGDGDMVSAGSYDVYLVKFDAAGTLQWSKQFGGTLHDMGEGVDTDASGNVFLTGHNWGTAIDLGGGPLPGPAGSYDGFLAKFSPAGNHVWSMAFGGTSTEQVWDLAVDGAGNPAVCGGFSGTVNFGTGNVSSGTTIRSDAFAVKYAGSGAASGVGDTPARSLSVTSYPNPFNPRTTISYSVPDPGHVTVAVYDAHGAHVATLFNGARMAGAYTAEWNGRATNGTVAGSGVYFVRIEHNGATSSHKMVLLK